MKTSKTLLTIALFISTLYLHAQEDEGVKYRYVAAEKKMEATQTETPANATEGVVSDNEPQFAGGKDAMERFIDRNINYDVISSDDYEGGSVVLRFKVTSEGFIKDIKILNSLGYACDREAIRIVNLMPRWEGALLNGQRVESDSELSISFDKSRLRPTSETASNTEQVIAEPAAGENTKSANSDGTTPPEYKGGEYAMWDFIDKNIDINLLDLNGAVIVTFEVLNDGRIGKIKITQSLNSACDNEAMRLVRSMPAWQPGTKNGRNVKTSHSISIDF